MQRARAFQKVREGVRTVAPTLKIEGTSPTPRGCLSNRKGGQSDLQEICLRLAPSVIGADPIVIDLDNSFVVALTHNDPKDLDGTITNFTSRDINGKPDA